jgi:hypothetical protein
MRAAYLVLGAQRSGTSAISHVLSQFDINFGSYDRFIQFAHNPIFFELKWVNELNNRIINALGHRYTDLFLPIEADFRSSITTEIETELASLIEQEWKGVPIIGIKDPRISLTFPVWEKVLSNNGCELRIVLAFRRPANFLKSNQRLFHNWEGWTVERHLNFWLQLNLAAIYLCREYPIYYLNYDQLVQDPVDEITQLANCFELDTTKISTATGVVQVEQTHHQSQEETGFAFVDRCYQLLCDHRLSPAEYLYFRSVTQMEQIRCQPKFTTIPTDKSL